MKVFYNEVYFLIQINLLFLYRFSDKTSECAHSSMDRIMDSGSIDWGSTPHERTF